MNEKVANAKRSGIVSVFQSIISKCTLALGLLTAGVFLFTLTGRYFFLAELACNFRFQILLALVAIGLISVVVKRYRLAGLLAFLAFLATSGTVSTYYPVAQTAATSQTLRIMSFNVLVTNRDYQSFIAEVLKQDPDVLTIIEYSKNGTMGSRILKNPIPM